MLAVLPPYRALRFFAGYGPLSHAELARHD
jgi:hypothetical protein